MIEIVIFDLNGTILDTEKAHWQAYHDILVDYGLDFALDEFTRDWTKKGKTLKDTLAQHNREDLLPKIDKIKHQKDQIFRNSLAERVRMMPGMYQSLKTLQTSYELALDSTSSRVDIDLMLGQFHLSGVFRLITSSDMAWNQDMYGPSSKSSRFKYIADSLHMAPAECMVIGDAEKDVSAATSCGMKIIAIPNAYTADNDFAGADKILSSAKELNASLRGHPKITPPTKHQNSPSENRLAREDVSGYVAE